MADKGKLLLKVLRRIPVFHALPPSLVSRLLGLCEARGLDEGQVLCRKDTASDEMYILVAGELSVESDGGLRVATLKPLTTVGEMGVITGLPRSATVAALRPSRVLALRKASFDGILDEDVGQRARVMRNFIELLAERVGDDNVRLRDVELEMQRFRRTEAHLLTRIGHTGARVDALLGLIERRSDLSRAAAEAAVDSGVRRGAPTVLIVDDEEEFRRLVSQALSYLDVVEAAGGEAALAILAEATPDLVITDVRMPGIDGFELAARIHRDRPKLPVLAVSGYVDAAELEGRGFAGFLDKPVEVRQFRAVVEAALAAATS